MNWTGGAINRVKVNGTHKNELRLQKEYFERKRLQIINGPNEKESNDKKNKDVNKKSKISQDIISFQRQCRMSFEKVTNANYRRVDFNSKHKPQGANSFGVNSVELPVSPIEHPSRLQLCSPLSTGAKPSHHLLSQNRDIAASSSHQSSYINLFGEPVVKTYKPFSAVKGPPFHAHHSFGVAEPYVYQRSGNRSSIGMTSNPFEDNKNQYSSFNSYNTRNENYTEPEYFSNTTFAIPHSDVLDLPDNFVGNNLPQNNENQAIHYRDSFYNEGIIEMFHSPNSNHPKQNMFQDNSNFSVKIIPSPESQTRNWILSPDSIQDEQSSYTSAIRWTNTINNGSSKCDLHHLELPDMYFQDNSSVKKEFPIHHSFEANHKPYHKCQKNASYCSSLSSDQYSASPQLTNIKDTNDKMDKNNFRNLQQRDNYEPHSDRFSYFQSSQMSPYFAVSYGLDKTPNLSLYPNAKRSYPKELSSEETSTLRHHFLEKNLASTAKKEAFNIRNVPAYQTLRSEEPLTPFQKTYNNINDRTLSKVTKDNHIGESLMKTTPGPVFEKSKETNNHNEDNFNGINDTPKIIDKIESSNIRSQTMESAAVSQDQEIKDSIKQLLSDNSMSEAELTNEAKIKKFDQKNQIPNTSIKVLSSDLCIDTTALSQTKTNNNMSVNIATQTTPKMYIDMSTSPIIEIVPKPHVSSNKFDVGDSIISSSATVYGCVQYIIEQ